MRFSAVTHAGRGHRRQLAPSPGVRAGTQAGVGTEKRRDLQGVRALAVLLVALNHANVPFLRGGYIGVDVFFVLSGYFITGLLLRESLGGEYGRGGEAASGRISIPRFYARRARRILPAATLTLAVTSVAVFVVYDLLRANLLGAKPELLDAFAASLFYANVHFAANATNYFAQTTTTFPSPVQHFWSLSVEEQFYLVWPSLLAGTLLICRHGHRKAFDRRRAVRLVGAVIALACAGSLLWSISDTAVSPQSAYFSTFARAWELGLGAGLALLAPRAASLPREVRIPLGWIGFGMVLTAAVFYSSATSFPGDAALLPVVGTALIVVAGLHGTRVGIDRLLGLRPFAYVGDRSYTFYLWHYPALIIVWQAAGHTLPPLDNVGLLIGAFALSAFTFHFYENPLRFARWLRGWRTAALVPVTMGAAVAAIIIPVLAVQATLAEQAVADQGAHSAQLRPARGQPDPRSMWLAKALPAVAQAVVSVRDDAPLPKRIVPDDARLEQENTLVSYDIPRGCQPSFGSGDTSKICLLGDPTAKKVVAVFGDSHAGMWMPALVADARAQKFAVVVLDKPGCFVDRVHTNFAGWPCATWYRWAMRQDHKLHPAVTLVAFDLSSGTLTTDPSATAADIRGVVTHVVRGVYLSDPPKQAELPGTCITAPGATMRSCSTPLPSGYTPLMQDIAQMLQHIHHGWIPVLQWFCADGICPMVIDHMLATRDGSHLTMEYSAALAPLLGNELRPILRRL
ncbi:MAG: acyltransferase [Conexibacteraceae bacterium]|nr:acyltransferase [Conexibacteraceae bacterium]